MIPASHDTHFYRCVFTDGDEYSIDFLDLCRKQPKLTFNTDYLNPKYVSIPLETPFKEIRIALPKEHCWKPIINPQPPYPGTYKEFIKALKIALAQYLLTLDPNQKYLMLHSSGMDSRFISGTMSQIRRKGWRTFDNIHFRCHQPECADFIRIMQAEGWPESQYSCWQHDPLDYYDVGREDICVQGWCSYTNQMNFWSDIIQDPKEWIVITGEGGELFKYLSVYPHNPPKYSDNFMLNMLIDHNPGKGEWENQFALYWKGAIMPLWSFQYLAVSNAVRKEWVKGDPKTGWDNIRRDLVKSVGLDFIKYQAPVYPWGISQQRKDEMLTLYNKGRFSRDYGHTNLDFFSNPSGWESCVWAFAVTVYDKIY